MTCNREQCLMRSKECDCTDGITAEALNENSGTNITRTVRYNTLVFVMTGKIEFSTSTIPRKEIEEKHVFLILQGSEYTIEVMEDGTCLLFCEIDESQTCEMLKIEINKVNAVESVTGHIVLPLRERFLQIINNYISVLDVFKCCLYNRYKLEEIQILFCYFYSPRELAALFTPMIS